LTVLAGVTNHTLETSKTASIHSVVELIVHPGYDTYSSDCDVGFLRLPTPIDFRATAKPISIAPASERPRHGDILVATGWGLTEVGQVRCAPETPRSVVLKKIFTLMKNIWKKNKLDYGN